MPFLRLRFNVSVSYTHLGYIFLGKIIKPFLITIYYVQAFIHRSYIQVAFSRIAMTRYIKRGGKVWIKIFPDKPVTAKPAEKRMGSGKGTLEYWVAVVKPGRVLFEIAGVPEDVAKEALRLATHKLPCKCKIVSRADLEGGDNSEN